MPNQHPAKPRVHHFVQAPVRPLDQDGVVVGIVGTIGWVVATVVLWLNLDWLQHTGHGWWLWTGISGTILGVIGTTYCSWRASRRRSSS